MPIAASGTIGVLYEAAIDDLIVFTAADFDESTDKLFSEKNFCSTENLRKTVKELSRKLHSPRSQPGLGP
jgi:hypothetical protein